MKKYAALFLVAIALISRQADAEIVLGVTALRDLVRFDSAAPGTILSSTKITGLEGSFESVAGIDFRPATGQLYAIGSAPSSIYRIYTVDPTTAVATKLGIDISGIVGNFLGFDFNPSADRIRIVTDQDQNVRFNPVTGLLAGSDTTLAFKAGDPNFGANPNIVGVAYTNNIAGASTTLLYDIDSVLDVLTLQDPPNNGTLATVGPLGVNFFNSVGFDISGVTGTAFATSGDQTTLVTGLYTINLSNGAATFLGNVGSGLLINDIAAPVNAVPEPSSLGLTSLAIFLLASRSRNRRRCAA